LGGTEGYICGSNGAASDRLLLRLPEYNRAENADACFSKHHLTVTLFNGDAKEVGPFPALGPESDIASAISDLPLTYLKHRHMPGFKPKA